MPKNGMNNASKSKGRSGMSMSSGQGTDTHVEIQRQIRNAGTNRVTGKADHLHRGDRRDMNKGGMK